MQMLLLVLNQVDKLDDLLESLMKNGISGATILNSTGMMHELAKNEEYQPIFGSAWYNIDSNRTDSKTIFLVLDEKQVDKVRSVVRQVIGDISKPNTAVLFTLPILSTEGIGF